MKLLQQKFENKSEIKHDVTMNFYSNGLFFHKHFQWNFVKYKIEHKISLKYHHIFYRYGQPKRTEENL